MTANELADILDRRGEDHQLNAANMLRQQAQEIKTLNNLYLDSKAHVALLQAEIEQLKSATIPYKDLHKVVTNVLAHPMRELTDEEIDNIFGICALNTTVTLTTEQCYWIVDAILKKASEK